MNPILPFLAAVAVAGSLSAQTTVLSEDFSTGVPPIGWTHVNNNAGIGVGWIDGAGRAWHEDEGGVGTTDFTLVSPAMDLTALTSVYLHFEGETNWANYLANHPSSLGDGISNMEVSTDGGLTWAVVWTDTSLNSGDTYSPDVDLSAYAGMLNVQLGIHFFGTFAQEWWVDNVLVNDNPIGPPPSGTGFVVNLPTTFAGVPFADNFDAGAGVIPSYMALTNVDVLTGLPDVEAWCNVGQLAPCLVPSSGAFNLEMGLDPLSINYHTVRNAMVLGIAGGGTANLALDFMGMNAGEESDVPDGVWISSDGANWFDVTGDWGTTLPLTNTWTSVSGVDLTLSPVDTTGNFYLMFQQSDNFPYNNLDGIGIDDIGVSDGSGGGLVYSITNLVAGQTAVFAVSGATAGGNVILGYSLSGAGPTTTVFGVVDMSLPISTLVTMTADVAGNASFSPVVPGGAAGATLYTQGVDLASGTLTNSLAVLVL